MAGHTLDDQLREVRREIIMRRKVYPRMQIDPEVAARQIALMESVADTLQALIAETCEPELPF